MSGYNSLTECYGSEEKTENNMSCYLSMLELVYGIKRQTVQPMRGRAGLMQTNPDIMLAATLMAKINHCCFSFVYACFIGL